MPVASGLVDVFTNFGAADTEVGCDYSTFNRRYRVRIGSNEVRNDF